MGPIAEGELKYLNSKIHQLAKKHKPTRKIQHKASPDKQNIIISYSYCNGMQFRI